MTSFLVVYGTGEGQTAKVAGRVVDGVCGRGHEATLVDAAEEPPSLDVGAFDAVVVGASIHYGRHQKTVRRFVESHRETLATKPTVFFQVSLASADESGAKEAAGYVEEFIEATGWHPDRIGLFGGALRFSQYGFLKRLLMRQIARKNLPDVDRAADTEFTDWHEVDAFAADVAAFVEGRLGVAPPASAEDTVE